MRTELNPNEFPDVSSVSRKTAEEYRKLIAEEKRRQRRKRLPFLLASLAVLTIGLVTAAVLVANRLSTKPVVAANVEPLHSASSESQSEFKNSHRPPAIGANPPTSYETPPAEPEFTEAERFLAKLYLTQGKFPVLIEPPRPPQEHVGGYWNISNYVTTRPAAIRAYVPGEPPSNRPIPNVVDESGVMAINRIISDSEMLVCGNSIVVSNVDTKFLTDGPRSLWKADKSLLFYYAGIRRVETSEGRMRSAHHWIIVDESRVMKCAAYMKNLQKQARDS